MPEESPPPRVPDGRVSTGNSGLDAMLEGGLVPHRPYLVVGPAGTGKSRLGLQFLCEGVRRGERALLVTIEEPPNEARVNHRGLAPDLDSVDVFDAIPDIMRYERTPFKDIASVRSATPFRKVPFEIRHTPELTSVEVTITALEQMLRSEVLHKNYTRVVIDSLTALQYFCMKGFDPVAGAQTFLRFLSDLQVTTILTVESPLEDADTPERMLARGEIRLFRWELDDQTVRAIGVEKFRGSPHDVRLHPYRIGPKGIDINLRVTISRDTRKIIEPEAPILPAAEPPTASIGTLAEAVQDLIAVGAGMEGFRTEVEAALAATSKGDLEGAELHLAGARALTVDLAQEFRGKPEASLHLSPGGAEALRRIRARAESVRVGVPPGKLPMPPELAAGLSQILAVLPERVLPPPVATEAPSPPGPAAPALVAAGPEKAVVAPPPSTVAPPPAPASSPATSPGAETLPAPPAPPPSETAAPAGEPPPPAPVSAAPTLPASRAPAPREVVKEPPKARAPAAREPPRETPPSVAEFLTPHSHLNPEPPPLPSARPSNPVARASVPAAPTAPSKSGRTGPVRTSETGLKSTRPTSRATGADHEGAEPPPQPVLPSAPEGGEVAPSAALPVTSPPVKKRRKAASAPKRKSAGSKPTAPTAPDAEAAPQGSVPEEAPRAPEPPTTGPTPGQPSPTAAAPEAAVPSEAVKPKRRPARKKKAPPVISATPGAPPEPSPTPVTTSASPTPPTEPAAPAAEAPKEGG